MVFGLISLALSVYLLLRVHDLAERLDAERVSRGELAEKAAELKGRLDAGEKTRAEREAESRQNDAMQEGIQNILSYAVGREAEGIK